MGINKLNILFENATQYKGKFKTIIIDGSNMIITQITAIKSSLLKDNLYSPWNTCNLNIIEQFYRILNNTVNFLISKLQAIKGLLMDNGEIIFVTDSLEDPKYITNDNRILNMKSDEREKRKQSQDRTIKILEQIERIKLDYGIYENGICINETEIKNLFNQMDFYNNPKHYLMLSDLIIRMLIGKINNVTYIKAISEADFVIKNLANLYNENPVLVMSKDTDYYVLLSEIPNVYKTDISLGNAIHYPYEIWNEILNYNISQTELVYIVTLIGNDYVSHESLLSMTEDGNKNINRIRGMLNIDNTFHSEILNSKMKKIKPLITFNLNSITNRSNFDTLINNIKDDQLKQRYRDSIIIYESWMLNSDFIILSTNDDEIEDLTRNKMEYILKYCGEIYNWIPSEIETCIESKLKNGEGFEIINDIYEFYEDICEDYLGMC